MFLLFCGLMFGGLLGLWGLHRVLARLGYRRSAVLLPALVLLAPFYLVYDAFYPGSDFYAQEFTRVTHQAFPAAGTVAEHEATFPDQHGAYTACARIVLRPPDYHRLQRQLRRDPAFHAKGSAGYRFLSLPGPLALSPGSSDAVYSYAFSGGHSAYGFVGFLPDGRTILLYRHRS